MLHIPKINNYLKILTDDEVKDFVAIHFGEHFKTTKVKLYSKLCEGQNIRKVAEWLCVFLTTPNKTKYVKMMQSNSSDNCVYYYNIEILNLFDPELQLINIKPMHKRKLKELLIKWKTFKVQTILVLKYKQKTDCKIFHSSAKLIAKKETLMKHLNPCIKVLKKLKILLAKIGLLLKQ